MADSSLPSKQTKCSVISFQSREEEEKPDQSRGNQWRGRPADTRPTLVYSVTTVNSSMLMKYVYSESDKKREKEKAREILRWFMTA